jgi:hypothetical protein
MKGIFIGARAAQIAFGEASICGWLGWDWTSDAPIVEFSCLMARRRHGYQYGIGKPEWACCCGDHNG